MWSHIPRPMHVHKLSTNIYCAHISTVAIAMFTDHMHAQFLN